MIRIISGQWGSRRIRAPKRSVRVTREVVREMIFSVIHDRLPGAYFLDLFGGSGINGFEASSRGAAHVVINEQDIQTVRLLHKNYALLLGDAAKQSSDMGNIEIIRGDALDYLRHTHHIFDFIFLDPPYNDIKLLEACLRMISKRALLSDYGYVILETNLAQFDSDNFTIYRHSRIGQTYVVMLTHNP